MSRRYLFFAVFSSGMTTLAVELTASRLLGNVFGTSNLVWASIIGLILIYLTVGYFIGGRWADRSPNERTFYTIMLWGAFTSGLVPLVSRPVLRFAAAAFDDLEMGILFGSFLAVVILFVVPITLLGAISPFAIRLAITQTDQAGVISGRVYAISTLGSFIGTFLPVLILIPMVGTTNTFIIFSTYLTIVALVGLARSVGWRQALVWIWMPLLLLLLAYMWSGTAFKSTPGQIYETESGYNYIEVLEAEDGTINLRLNDGQGVHSRYHPERLAFDGPWMQFLAGPFFNAPVFSIEQVESIAIVGLAAGTTARQATEVFGPIPIDGFEIDPVIIEVGREYFGMTMSNLNAIAQDGRWGLAHSQRRYSLIAIDAYRPPYIPWHLTTKEFFEITREHLTEHGVVAINVGRAPRDRSLIDALVTTLQTVFPSVHVMDIPWTFNTMVYASMQPTSFENLQVNNNALINNPDSHPLLLQAIERVILYQQPVPEGTLVFTDDHAPVEWIVNNMVLRFILAGEYEDLQ
ncbi:MAG: spermine synthase [Chloroflexi bacterium]|nr:spermine synthase [Chloroflexota bacterium]